MHLSPPNNQTDEDRTFIHSCLISQKKAWWRLFIQKPDQFSGTGKPFQNDAEDVVPGTILINLV